MTTLERVLKVIEDQIGVEATAETKLLDITSDSMEMLSLIVELETEFNIDLEDEHNLCTVADVVKVLEKEPAK